MSFSETQQRVAQISSEFAADRTTRQQRRHLDRADFDRLRDAGLTQSALPSDQGGWWESVPQSTRPLCRILRDLARGDSSVALVSAMHPAVVSYWLTAPAELAQRAPWQRQCEKIFSTIREGHWWGTITSEPGSGGDITRSQTNATHGADDTSYFITGQKHFGSGSGVMDFMVTTAIPEGGELPEWFYVDVRDVPWDGSQGIRLTAEWDGHGMIATQSHSFAFEHFPATRMAWSHSLLPVAANAGAFIGCLFTSVIVGIVEEAVATAGITLLNQTLGTYQQREWTQAQLDMWLIDQALEGMLRAIETGTDARREVLMGKTAIAELSESVLTRLCRTIGGSTLARRSPFGCWLNDVRALGFLRPPWPLAYKTLEAQAGA